MSTVVVLSPSPCEARFEEALAGAATVVRCWQDEFLHLDPAKVVEECGRAGAAVICLGPDLPTKVALSIADAFDRERPDCAILLMAKESAGVWAAALRAGARDVVAPGVSRQELSDALDGVLAVAERRQAIVAEGQRRAAATEASRVIAVVSPKGGSGKTTVSTNLAVGLAKQQPGSTALVDLDLQFGDVASALQLSPEQTVADVARAPSDFDATMLKVFLSAHHTGLFALCAPLTPAEADDVTAAHTAHVVDLLRSEFAYVVIDTAAGIDEHSIVAVEAATDLVLVGAMDVTSVRSLRKELDVFDQLGQTSQRRHLVLNRSDAKVGMDAADIEAVLGLPVDVAVPSSRLAPISSNEGTPLLEAPPRSPIARSLLEIVGRFAEAEEPDPGLVSGFRRLRGAR
ncbi:MAG TPA: AAA family ATPase [Acidimicrobiales bacterium]|nr:AAA family ATPase [Acidimicrobiales bacterium]